MRHIDQALACLGSDTPTSALLCEDVVRFNQHCIRFREEDVLRTETPSSAVFTSLHAFATLYATPEERLLADYIWVCATRDVRAVVSAWLFARTQRAGPARTQRVSPTHLPGWQTCIPARTAPACSSDCTHGVASQAPPCST